MTTDQNTTHAVHEFRVMGTDAQLLMRSDQATADPLFAMAERGLHQLSARLTRFEPTSDLEQLNDRGSGVTAGALRTILTHAARFGEETDGRFDIGIGAELIAAGYDRTFDSLATRTGNDARTSRPPVTTEHAARPAGPSFTIDTSGAVRIRPGARLDLGGIAKGWAADRVCAKLGEDSGASCLVSLGGDIAVHVIGGDDPWPIGVVAGDHQQTLGLAFGGLATSGQDKRVWQAPDGSGLAHHVIDPRTGKPSTTDVLRITVVAESAMMAEVWTKSLMLSGFDEAVTEATRRNMATVIVRKDGSTAYTGSLESLGNA